MFIKNSIIAIVLVSLSLQFSCIKGMRKKEQPVLKGEKVKTGEIKIEEKPRKKKPVKKKLNKKPRKANKKRFAISREEGEKIKKIGYGLAKYVGLMNSNRTENVIKTEREIGERTSEFFNNYAKLSENDVEDIKLFFEEKLEAAIVDNNNAKRTLNDQLLEIERSSYEAKNFIRKHEKIGDELINAIKDRKTEEYISKLGADKIIALTLLHSSRIIVEGEEQKKEINRRLQPHLYATKAFITVKKWLKELEGLHSTERDLETNDTGAPIVTGTPIVNVAIFLDTIKAKVKEKPGYYDVDVIVRKCINAIRQGVQVIVVGAPVLRSIFDFYNWFESEKDTIGRKGRFLVTIEEGLKNKITGRLFDIYVTREYEDETEPFAVLISKENNGETIDLKSLGLDDNYLRPIEFTQINDELSENTEAENQVDCLKKIFYDPEDEKDNLPNKLIYINGHGFQAKNLEKSRSDIVTPGTYMGLESQSYVSLVEHFDKTKCLALSISTCYGGGNNALTMNQNIVSFPIVIGAIADNVSYGFDNINFTDYYNKMKELFTTRIKFADWRHNQTFKEALKSIVYPSINCMPLILLPGSEYFRAVNIRNKAIELTEYTSGEDNEKIRTNNRTEALLFYKEIFKSPIEIPYLVRVPAFISMIAARAHHFLIKLEAPTKHFKILIQGILGKMQDVSPKMFFIRELSCQSYNRYEGPNNPFDPITRSLNLQITNFFLVKKCEIRGNTNVFYLTGSGVINDAVFSVPRYYLFTKTERGKRRFSFSYDTERKQLQITPINKDQYRDNLVMALTDTIPRKGAIAAANPGNLDYLLRNDYNNEVHHDVDAKFLPEVNSHVKPEEGVELRLFGNEEYIKIITESLGEEEGLGFLKRLVGKLYTFKDTAFSYRPLTWLPVRVRNWFVSPPQEELEREDRVRKKKR